MYKKSKTEEEKQCEEQNLLLIQEVQARPTLWSKTDPKYKNKIRQQDLWEQIAINVDIPVAEVRERWKMLRNYYRNLRARVNKSQTSGSSSQQNKRPVWYAWEAMGFLEESVDVGDTVDSLPTSSSPNPSQFQSRIPRLSPRTGTSSNRQGLEEPEAMDLEERVDVCEPTAGPSTKHVSNTRQPVPRINRKTETNPLLEEALHNYNELCKKITKRMDGENTVDPFTKYLEAKLRAKRFSDKSIIEHRILAVVDEFPDDNITEAEYLDSDSD